MNLAGHEFNEVTLIHNVMRNIHPVFTEGYGCYMWVKVMRTFGVGSTVAKALCEEFGFDPEMRVRK
jgi:hypothetical protein